MCGERPWTTVPAESVREQNVCPPAKPTQWQQRRKVRMFYVLWRNKGGCIFKIVISISQIHRVWVRGWLEHMSSCSASSWRQPHTWSSVGLPRGHGSEGIEWGNFQRCLEMMKTVAPDFTNGRTGSFQFWDVSKHICILNGKIRFCNSGKNGIEKLNLPDSFPTLQINFSLL